jgi:hypothetical protein
MGTGDFSPGVMRPEIETKHWLPTSVDVKNTCIYTSTPTYVFMV